MKTKNTSKPIISEEEFPIILKAYFATDINEICPGNFVAQLYRQGEEKLPLWKIMVMMHDDQRYALLCNIAKQLTPRPDRTSVLMRTLAQSAKEYAPEKYRGNPKNTDKPEALRFYDIRIKDYFAFLMGYIDTNYYEYLYDEICRLSAADENYLPSEAESVNEDATIGEILCIANRLYQLSDESALQGFTEEEKDYRKKADNIVATLITRVFGSYFSTDSDKDFYIKPACLIKTC